MINGDALDLLRSIPDGTADLILTDPPYNIRKASWDYRPDYVDFLTDIFAECNRATKPNGQLIFWHNEPRLMAQIWQKMEQKTPWILQDLITCPKPGHRTHVWKHATANLRSLFPITEYICSCVKRYDGTHHTADIGAGIRAYLKDELDKAKITREKLKTYFREWGQGGTGAVLSHYFARSQYQVPTRKVYTQFFQAFLREKTGMRDLFPNPYDEIAAEVESECPVHNTDAEHCNVWMWPKLNDTTPHPCAKPLPLLRRLLHIYSNPGALVLDPFAGSGSTGVACVETGRRFLGSELDPGYFETAQKRISSAQPLLFS